MCPPRRCLCRDRLVKDVLRRRRGRRGSASSIAYIACVLRRRQLCRRAVVSHRRRGSKEFIGLNGVHPVGTASIVGAGVQCGQRKGGTNTPRCPQRAAREPGSQAPSPGSVVRCLAGSGAVSPARAPGPQNGGSLEEAPAGRGSDWSNVDGGRAGPLQSPAGSCRCSCALHSPTPPLQKAPPRGSGSSRSMAARCTRDCGRILAPTPLFSGSSGHVRTQERRRRTDGDGTEKWERASQRGRGPCQIL